MVVSLCVKFLLPVGSCGIVGKSHNAQAFFTLWVRAHEAWLAALPVAGSSPGLSGGRHSVWWLACWCHGILKQVLLWLALISMAVLCLVSQCHCTYSFSSSLRFSQTSDRHGINLDRFTNPTNQCTRFAFVGLVISNTALWDPLLMRSGHGSGPSSHRTAAFFRLKEWG